MAYIQFREGKDGFLRAYYVVTQNGQRKWIPRGRVLNRKLALREFKAWQRQADKKEFFNTPAPSPTLLEFTPAYLEYAKGRTLTGEGFDRAQGALKPLNRLLGRHRLNEITSALVDGYVSQRKAETSGRTHRVISPKTVNNEVTQLSAVMEAAIRLGKLEAHPFKTPRNTLTSFFLKTEKKIPTVLFPDEIQRLMETAKENPHNLAVFVFLLLTGMRKSEVAGLKWEHVDLAGRKITFAAPKTDDFRTIPLSDILIELLHHMRAFWPEPLGPKAWRPRTPAQMTYVFCDSEGKPYRREIGGFLRLLAQKSGVEKKVTPHVLRHSFAAHGRSKFTVFQLQKLLGHRNVSTTEKYGFLLDDGMRDGTNEVAKSMGITGLLALTGGTEDAESRLRADKEKPAPKEPVLQGIIGSPTGNRTPI